MIRESVRSGGQDRRGDFRRCEAQPGDADVCGPRQHWKLTVDQQFDGPTSRVVEWTERQVDQAWGGWRRTEEFDDMMADANSGPVTKRRRPWPINGHKSFSRYATSTEVETRRPRRLGRAINKMNYLLDLRGGSR